MNPHIIENNFIEWPPANELADVYMKIREDCLKEMLQFGILEDNIEVHPWRLIDKTSAVGYNFTLSSMQSYGEIVVRFAGIPFRAQ